MHIGASQPNKMYNKVTLTRDFRRVAKAITKETADNFYRPDLKKGERMKSVSRVLPVCYGPGSSPLIRRACVTHPPRVPHFLSAVLAKWSLIHKSQKKA